VADINPEVKRALHAALVASGKTLKEWLVERALAEIEQHANARASVAYQTVGRSREAPLFGEAAVTTIGGTAHASEAVDAVKPPRPEERRSVVSMFSGCGGMDLGFLGGFRSLGVEYPRSSFDIIWANDFNLKACDTYRHNIGSHIVPGDVWEAMETMPETADVVIGGFPCQDISVAGKQKGLRGERSGIYFSIIDLVKGKKEEDKPTFLLIENVKNLLSINSGFDFTTVLSELDEAGYDAMWQVLNSKNFGVPQNRERVFIVANLRSGGRREILPVEGENGAAIKQIIGGPQGYRVMSTEGVSCTLASNAGGVGAKTGLYFIDQSTKKTKLTEESRCITSRYTAGITNRTAMNSGVLEAYPVLTPERFKKRQNGRRMKNSDEPMFTLTSQDRHGVAIKEATKKGARHANDGQCHRANSQSL